MKTLYLQRHAKSSWTDPTLDDFDRPLNGRGRRAGTRIGTFLRDEDIRPALILCSAAKRARQTLKLIQAELGGKIPAKIEKCLYMATSAELLKRLAKVDDKVSSVMLIGHNPETQHLALELAGSGDGEAWESMSAKFPTAALAVLQCDIERWRDLRPQKASLESFVRPRDLA